MTIKLRTNVRIPARVVSGPGISQSISNGVLTTELDIESIDPAVSIPDPAAYRIFIYNDDTNEWESTTLDNVPTTTTGDAYTGRGDAAYNILSTDRYIELTATLTAARAWTLPAASAVPAGTRMTIHDAAGGITSTNTLTIGVTGADTINGASTFVINAARAGVEFRSDGSSGWSVGLIFAARHAANSVGDAALRQSAALSVVGRSGNSTGNVADITAGTDGYVLTRSGTSLVFGQVQTAGLADLAVSTAKIADANVTTAKIADANVTAAKVASGFAVDTAYAEYTTSATITTAIPYDNTTPQVSEGTQILSAAITPKSTTNKVRARVTVSASVAADGNVIAALFRNGGANALRSRPITLTTNFMGSLAFEFEDVPASTSAQTYTVRVGPNAAGTAYLNFNGITSGLLGSAGIACTLTLEEFKA